MESVMWNSTNYSSSADKESGDPVHEIRNPRYGIQSKTVLDSRVLKLFHLATKAPSSKGKYI